MSLPENPHTTTYDQVTGEYQTTSIYNQYLAEVIPQLALWLLIKPNQTIAYNHMIIRIYPQWRSDAMPYRDIDLDQHWLR